MYVVENWVSEWLASKQKDSETVFTNYQKNKENVWLAIYITLNRELLIFLLKLLCD